MSNNSVNNSSYRNANKGSLKRGQSKNDDQQASIGSKKHKHKRTSTLKTGEFMTSADNESFARKKNEKTIFKILSNRMLSKKIVPTIPSKTERFSLSKAIGSIPKSGSTDRQIFYPSASTNRAHLIAPHRELLHPSDIISQIKSEENQ